MLNQLQCKHCGTTFDAVTPDVGGNGKCPQCGELVSPRTKAESASAKAVHRAKVTQSSKAASETAASAKASDASAKETEASASESVASANESEASANEAQSPEPAEAAAQSAGMAETAKPRAKGDVVIPSEVAVPPKPPDDPFAEFAVYDGPSELVYDTAAGEGASAEPQSRVDPAQIAVPRSILYLQGGLLVLVAVACFGLGVLFGTITGTRTEQQLHVPRPCVIGGTVVTRGSRDGDEPDDGAVVLIVPQNARPDERVNVEGLRPGDPMPDRDHPSLRAFTALGGDYTRTDAQGHFRLRVPDTGEYFLLVVSHRAKRSGDEPLNRTHIAEIGGYVIPAAQLIGEQRYRWQTQRIDRDATLNIVLE